MNQNFKKWLKWIVILCFFIAVTIVLTVWINAAFFRYTDALVYKTKTGDCYHSAECQYLRYSAIGVGWQEARNAGLYACSRCGGIPHQSIVVNDYFLSFFIALILEIAVSMLLVLLKTFLKKQAEKKSE